MFRGDEMDVEDEMMAVSHFEEIVRLVFLIDPEGDVFDAGRVLHASSFTTMQSISIDGRHLFSPSSTLET